MMRHLYLIKHTFPILHVDEHHVGAGCGATVLHNQVSVKHIHHSQKIIR